MSAGELVEGLVMIAVIVAWWPLIFLGWQAPAYRLALYLGSAILLAIILVRRVLRLEQGFRESGQKVDEQYRERYGPRPPLILPPYRPGPDPRTSPTAEQRPSRPRHRKN
jgi:hypothetical protein